MDSQQSRDLECQTGEAAKISAMWTSVKMCEATGVLNFQGGDDGEPIPFALSSVIWALFSWKHVEYQQKW